MKALSIRQPWAWAILFAGKDVENRDWRDSYPGLHEAHRLIEDAIVEDGGEFLIHAAKGMTKAEYEDALDLMHAISRKKPFPEGLTLPAFGELQRGGIVGSVQLYDVVTESESLWFAGRIGLVLRNPKPIPFRACKGALGFFEADNDGIRIEGQAA
jgi:hypothetical protein